MPRKRPAETPEQRPEQACAPRTADAVAVDLRAAREALAEHEAAVSTASARYDVALDDGRDAALAARQSLTEAEVDRDVARRKAEKLEGEHAAAMEREAGVRQVDAYERARSRGDAAATALESQYPVLAAAIVSIIVEIAQAEAEINAVNADLPPNCSKLPRIEGRVRNLQNEDEEIVSSELTHRWVEQGQSLPGSITAEHVHQTTPRRGVIEVPGMPRKNWPQAELRTFIEERFVPRLGGRTVDSLAEKVALPGLYNLEADLWKPVQRFEGVITPDDVLRQAAKLQARARKVADRPIETRLRPHGDYTPRVQRIETSDTKPGQASPWG